MTKNLWIACMVIAIGCNEATSTTNEQPATEATANQATANWPDKLIGRWEGAVEGNRYVEDWKRGCDNNYEGRSEIWQGEKMLGSETMRISEFAGHWMFMASPDGQQVTAFQLEKESVGSWTFANEEHDFPQRISYNLKGDDLNAWIEGPGENGPMRISFDLRKVKS